MKVKKEYIILILIIAGLSAYLFMRSSDRTLYQLPQIAGLEQKQITKIEISKEGNSIIFNKKDNKWYLDPPGYLVDANKVNDMLNVFETLTLTALVSESEDYVRYDLDAGKKITVKAWQEDSLKRDFDIGKPASSFRHTFVKLNDDSRVFHARDNFRGKFDLAEDNLRDKSVLSFKVSVIQEIQIAKDQTSLKLTRTQIPVELAKSEQEKSENSAAEAVMPGWQSPDGKQADALSLHRLLTTLAKLSCDAYIKDRNKDAFSDPIYTVKLKGTQDFQLDIFAKLQTDDKNHPAVSSANDYPFFLSDSKVQKITINPEEMLKKPESDKKTSEPPKPE
ncbi:MAG: DUF4340 domain-containing protein [Desulfobacterales bacterium]